MIVEYLDGKGCMIDWTDFYKESVRHGWPSERTFRRMKGVVGEVYGPKFRENWEPRMRGVMRLLAEQDSGG